MPILDFHTHCFPDSLAKRAMETLMAGCSGIDVETDGTVADLIRLMDLHQVDEAVICNIATKPSQATNILEWSQEIRSERIIPFASIHPDSAKFADEAARAAEAGIKGVKLHPLYQNFNVDDPRVFPLYDAIAQNGLVLLCHAGYDVAFHDEDAAMPWRFAAVRKNFPNLKLVMAHLGGWRAYDQFIETLCGDDVWIDTSFAIGYCDDRQRDAILNRHDINRILFASDSPWGGMADHIRFVNQFPIPDESKECIFHGNALRLLNQDC